MDASNFFLNLLTTPSIYATVFQTENNLLDLMKRRLLKTAFVITLMVSVGFVIFLAAHINPYLYTNVYGDAGTKNLYKLYRLATNGVEVSRVRKFAEANGIVVIDHEKDSMFSAHNDSEANSEEVYVWYSNSTVTNARFNINNP